MKLEIGSKVERVASDYTNGRRGQVIEINAERGRARVLWTSTAKPLRTWILFSDLKALA